VGHPDSRNPLYEKVGGEFWAVRLSGAQSSFPLELLWLEIQLMDQSLHSSSHQSRWKWEQAEWEQRDVQRITTI